MSAEPTTAPAEPTAAAPALSRGLAVVPVDGALLVQGSGTRHVFRGRAATGLLPRLLALLDGSRDPAALAEALGVPPRTVDQALGLLRERGLLDAVPPTDVADHVLDHYGRGLEESGGHRTTGDLLGLLARAAVRVTGAPEVAAAVAADLRECGLRDAVAGPLDAAGLRALAAAPRALAVVIEGGGDGGDGPGGGADGRGGAAEGDGGGNGGGGEGGAPGLLARTAARCGGIGVPVMRAAVCGGTLELGPLFLPDHTACPDCAATARADAGLPPADAPTGAGASALAGLVAGDVLARVSGASARRLTALTRVAADGAATENLLVVPEPGCGCADIGGEGDGGPDLADVALWATERSMPAVLRAGPPARAVRRSWAELQGERPDLPAHPRLPLDDEPLALPGAFGDPPPVRASGAPGTGELGGLLARVAGLRRGPGDPQGQRWAPSGGRLGSVELYLATRDGVAGLPGTLFRYDDLAHALIAVRADPVPPEAALAGSDLAPEGLDAVLVFTAAHARLARKYQDFAHRLAHLDAGCAAAQLAAVATARGLQVRFATRWDGSPAEVLDLGPEQYVTAVAGLHRGEPCR